MKGFSGIFLSLVYVGHAIVQKLDIVNNRMAILLPFDIPKLLQDPQTMPRDTPIFFGVHEGAILDVNIEVKASQYKPLHDTFMSSERFNPTFGGLAANLCDNGQCNTTASHAQVQCADCRTESATYPPMQSLHPLTVALQSVYNFAAELVLLIVRRFEGQSGASRLAWRSANAEHMERIKMLSLSNQTGQMRKQRYKPSQTAATYPSVSCQTHDTATLNSQRRHGVDSSNGGKSHDTAHISAATATKVAGVCSIRFDNATTNSDDETETYTPIRQLKHTSVTDSNYDETHAVGIDHSNAPDHAHEPITDLYLFAITYDQWTSIPLVSKAESYLKIPLSTKIQFRHVFRISDRMLICFLNLNKKAFDISGTMSIINPGGVHLSTSQLHEGPSAFYMFILYLGITIAVSIILVANWDLQRQTPLHLLMLATAAVKTIYLSMDWKNAELFNTTGYLSPWHWVLTSMLCKIEYIATLMLFLVLGLGWRVFRHHLTQLEARLCSALCMSSFYLSVFEESMGGFRTSRYIIHAVTGLIIVAASFDITILTAHLSDMNISISTGENYQKLMSYCIFRWVLVAFIIRPSILLMYKLSLLEPAADDPDDPKYDWLVLTLDNVMGAAMFVTVVYAFRPVQPLRVFKALLSQNAAEESSEQRSNNLEFTDGDLFG